MVITDAASIMGDLSLSIEPAARTSKKGKNKRREIHSFNFTFLLIGKKSIFEVPITVFDIFFSKSTGDIDIRIGIDSHAYTRSS